ncbi:DUF4268 domain-containing protein [Mucilaginibacter koreensis]
MTIKLGTLKNIDLRSVWGHEALHFTRWLAKDENIGLLADELDIDLENIKPEESAGRYTADILADDAISKRKVIIENQLEATDHKHLGQILTYASAHDAGIIIWIVKDYTEEHKQAIDWLNRHMPEEISFFLVQIELWQIGSSDPAPKFNIISQPNNWAKTIKNASSSEKGSPSELKLFQQKFWQCLKDYVDKLEVKTLVNYGRTPRPQHWYDISFGTSKALISLTFNSKQNQIGCELYIKNDESIYEAIKQHRGPIEQSLGDDIQFMDLPESAAFRVIKYYSCNPLDEAKWNEYFLWLNKNAEKFQKTFKKYF